MVYIIVVIPPALNNVWQLGINNAGKKAMNTLTQGVVAPTNSMDVGLLPMVVPEDWAI